MSTSNYINFTIKKGEGITYGIDRKLDEHFGKDVSLKGSAWSEVMNVVKSDNATGPRQYRGGDTDIYNSKHFVVKEGDYKLSKTAWDTIIEIAKKALGMTEELPAQVSESEEVVVSELQQDENVEVNDAEKQDVKLEDENLKNILGEEAFNKLSDDYKSKVSEKYAQIKAKNPNISDAEISKRLANYIKALDSHAKELEMGKYFETKLNDDLTETAEEIMNNCPHVIMDEDIKKAKMVTGDDADRIYYQSYLDRGQGYVDLYDTNGDEIVSKEEFIAFERKDAGEDAMTEEENKKLFAFLAKNKDHMDFDDYVDMEETGLGKNFTEEEKKEIKTKFNIIAGSDGKIDFDEYTKMDEALAGALFEKFAGTDGADKYEMACHLGAMSRIYDGNTKSTGEDITFKEWFALQDFPYAKSIEKNYNYWFNWFVEKFNNTNGLA